MTFVFVFFDIFSLPECLHDQSSHLNCRLMNDIISQNKVRESIRNDVTNNLICLPCKNIQNGSSERSKKNSEGSSVNFE